MNFPFLKYSKIYFVFSGLLIVASIFALFAWGLNWGIDFAGGSVLRVEYREQRPPQEELARELAELDLRNFSVHLRGEKEVVVRMVDISLETQKELTRFFEESPGADEETIMFEAVSPIVGEETKGRARTAIIFAILAIVLYIAIVFRKVSRPIKSWQYGIATIIALGHDVLIPVGLFAVLGHFKGVEFSIPILTAVLTIFGYSVNDTVVVFDRIRENILKGGRGDFEEAVNKSLNQTLVRSLNTSFTTILVLLAIFFFGGETLSYFSLALIAGIIAGSYSSIFLASPVLYFWFKFKQK